MSERQTTTGTEKQWAFFMDVLGHDILNDNQAVLSYLELVLTYPGLDPKARSYAERAISHVRTSTLLVEHAKNLMAARTVDARAFKPADLMRAVMLASKELTRYFPGKNLRVRVSRSPPQAFVIGDKLAEDLVLNSFIDMVKSDPGDVVDMEVVVAKAELDGRICWGLQVADSNAVIQPGAESGELADIVSQDISKTVRMADRIYAMLAAKILGGSFSAKPLEAGRGVRLTLNLVKAGVP